MADNTKIWRVQRREWKDREENLHVDEILIGPGYSVTVDTGVTSRKAEPRMPKGKFILHDNGFGTLQIINRETNQLFFACPYLRDLGEVKAIDPEEALGSCQAVVDLLNKGMTDARDKNI